MNKKTTPIAGAVARSIENMSSLDETRSILRWGGVAGVLAGIIFLFVPVTLFGFVPPAPADPVQLVSRFPSVRTPIMVGNTISFVADVMWVGFLLGLYRALRGSSPAPALWGTVLILLGFAVLFVEVATQVAFDPLSNLYRTPGITSAQQTSLGQVWEGTQGMFNQFDTSAILLISAGLFVLGLAMLKAPTFGKILGGIIMLIGAMSVVTGLIFGTTATITAVFLLPIYVILPIILGLKVYRLSKIV